MVFVSRVGFGLVLDVRLWVMRIKMMEMMVVVSV